MRPDPQSGPGVPIVRFIAKIAIIWAIGIIILIVGAVLELLGMVGHAVGGRKHYF